MALKDVATGALEQLAKLKSAGAAVGLADHKRTLDAAARRTEEGHRAQAKAAGMSDVLMSDSTKTEEMSDVTVTGDITNHHHHQPESKLQNGGGRSWVLPLAMMGLSALGGTGVGALAFPAVSAWFQGKVEPLQPKTDVKQKPIDEEVEIDFAIEDGKLVFRRKDTGEIVPPEKIK